jgi:hypothetical protein
LASARPLLRQRCAWGASKIAPQFSQRSRHIDLRSTRAPSNRCRQAFSSEKVTLTCRTSPRIQLSIRQEVAYTIMAWVIVNEYAEEHPTIAKPL